MPDFKRLFEEVLKQRVDLDEESLMKLVEEKKRRVGAGYLTDQGALFLVASDLGVSLEQIASADLTLKDLYVGANEITLVGRVFSIYPIRRYVRRDGSEGSYRRIILFDEDTCAKATLWDDKARLIEELSIGVETPIRIVKGYVRSGLDGRPVLNLGSRGTIELIEDQDMIRRLPTLDKVTKDVSEIRSPSNTLAVFGVVKSQAKISQFQRRDGGSGCVTQLHLVGLKGGRQVRVAIWDKESTDLLGVPINATIRLVNVRGKILPHGEVELHGDEGTSIQTISTEEIHPSARGEVSKEVVKTFRLISKGILRESQVGHPSISALMMDRERRLCTLIARSDACRKLVDVKMDGLMHCSGRESGASKIVCESESSIEARSDDDQSHPTFTNLLCKVNSIKEGASPLFLEVIALSRTTVQDITTRDGSMVKKAEVMVGDDTGEIKIVAWRDLTESLAGLVPGQRLMLRGLTVQMGRDSSPILQLRSYSSVERVT